jgi:hypothetical protein
MFSYTVFDVYNSFFINVNNTFSQAYKNCPEWDRSYTIDHAEDESDKFIAGPEYQNLIHNVSIRLGFSHKINNGKLKKLLFLLQNEIKRVCILY